MTSDPSDIEDRTEMTGAELRQRAQECGVDIVDNAITSAYMADHCAATGETPEFEGLAPVGHFGRYTGTNTIWEATIAEHMPEPPQNLPKMASAFEASASPSLQSDGQQPVFDPLLKGPM